MNSTLNFDSFFKQVTDALPKSFVTLHHDFEKNLRVAMESAFHKMNLVTREEFDIQIAVLERTRARLEELETKIATLEAAHLPKSDLPKPDLSNLSEPQSSNHQPAE